MKKALKKASKSSQKIKKNSSTRLSSRTFRSPVKRESSSSWADFEKRKQDHIRLSLDPRVQRPEGSDLDKVRLKIDGLPDLNFDEIDVSVKALGQFLSSPIFISSMTAGHQEGDRINALLAELSHNKQILFAVGSLRRELTDLSSRQKWRELQKRFPRAPLIGNLGVSEVVKHGAEKVLGLIENFSGVGFYIHWNSLQEIIQPEGGPQFRGAMEILQTLVRKSHCPILIKEVGCGMSADNVRRLSEIGVHVVDLAGRGGTHWGRLEGLRAGGDPLRERASLTFENWGLSNVRTLMDLQKENVSCQLWASGGIRQGLDAAKMISMGAQMVGVAQPWMEAIVNSTPKSSAAVALETVFETFQFELKTALFCTGSANLAELRGRFEKVS